MNLSIKIKNTPLKSLKKSIKEEEIISTQDNLNIIPVIEKNTELKPTTQNGMGLTLY